MVGRDGSAGLGQQQADVFVIFGITGDLAKVMTFRSLYRLEKRGLLQWPIVGVASRDWTVNQLVQRARESISGTGEELDNTIFERFAARLSYVHGDFADAETYQRVGAAMNGAQCPVFYLEIPPFLFATTIKGLSEAGLTKTGRVVVEKPFGHDLASARALAEELHQYVDESQLISDRPLPRKDGARGDLVPAVRQHDARARLESELRQVRTDHYGGNLRG
jgi:glucose-6-phosphate 1-dehydrogenase